MSYGHTFCPDKVHENIQITCPYYFNKLKPDHFYTKRSDRTCMIYCNTSTQMHEHRKNSMICRYKHPEIICFSMYSDFCFQKCFHGDCFEWFIYISWSFQRLFPTGLGYVSIKHIIPYGADAVIPANFFFIKIHSGRNMHFLLSLQRNK